MRLDLPGLRHWLNWWPSLALGLSAVFALSAVPALTQEAPPNGQGEDNRVYATSNIHYVLDPNDPSVIARVEFNTSGDVPDALVISLLADRSFWYDCVPSNGRSFWRCDTTVDVRASVRAATLLTIGSAAQSETPTPTATATATPSATAAPPITQPLEVAPSLPPAPVVPTSAPAPVQSPAAPIATTAPQATTQPSTAGGSTAAPQGTPPPTVEVLPLTPPPATATAPPIAAGAGAGTRVPATSAPLIEVLPLGPSQPAVTATATPRVVQPAPGLPHAGGGTAADSPISPWLLLSVALMLAAAGLAGLSRRRRWS